MFDFIRSCSMKPTGDLDYNVFGHSMCRDFFQMHFAVSKHKINKIKMFMRNGMLDYPHLQQQRLKASAIQQETADAWFSDLYFNVAETHAQGSEDVHGSMAVMEEAVVCKDHPLWVMGIAAREAGQRKVPKKFLGNMTLEQVFEMHAQACQGESVSRATLRRAWVAKWNDLIKIMPVRKHARCTLCAELDEFRKKANTEAERLQYQEDKSNHIKDIKADRSISTRGNKLSEEAVANPSTDGHQQVLRVTIDGMDQAKFKLPRNLQMAKSLEASWRPQMSVHGVIVHGLFEAYFLAGPDVHKDANMEATVIARTLDIIQEMYKEKNEHFCVPKSIIVNPDNTPREAKNSIFHTFMAHLESANRTAGNQVEFFHVGHTHNEQDQHSFYYIFASLPAMRFIPQAPNKAPASHQ